jgi:flagella basal body P-ring formation protein FlgA
MTVIPVPKVTIYPGETLTADKLGELKVVVRERAAGLYHLSREGVVDKVARRTLRAGAAIPANALREPYVFKDGQRVDLVYGSGALSIRASGIAIEPGVVGAVVGVRNMDTGVVVRGLVQPDGSVQLNGG